MIKDLRNGEIISKFPHYGKHDLGGSRYGYLVLTKDLRVLYFYLSNYNESSEIEFEDVTNNFEIMDYEHTRSSN